MTTVPRSNTTLFVILAGAGSILDLTTKWLVFTHVGTPSGNSRPPSYVIWPDVFSITTSFNKGALWGIGSSIPFANFAFAGLSLLAGLLIVYWLFWHGAAKDRWLTVALGLIMAGTAGNCYDRLVWRQVRDWIYFELIDWPIFNIADSMLVCGAGVLMLQAVFSSAPGGESVETPVVASGSPHEAS